MNIAKIGALIKQERIGRDISRTKLTAGVCSEALLECLRGDFLGFMLEEKTYTLDRMTGDNSKSRQRYRQSYQLRRLMKASERQKAPIERAFKEWYGEDIRNVRFWYINSDFYMVNFVSITK